MNTLYYLINSYQVRMRVKEFDCNIPFNVSFPDSTFPSMIQYEDWTNISVDERSQILFSITRISNEKILYSSSKLILTGLILYRTLIAIGCDESLKFEGEDNENWFTMKRIDKPTTLVIFLNALVLYLPGAGSPKYFIEESEEFGAIADKDFNIIAFVVKGITPAQIESLSEYVQRNPPLEQVEFPHELQHMERNYPMMENKDELIKKILSLNNVDYWNLIYFGLERALIDNTFIINFAIEYLASEKVPKNDKITIEIAALLKHECENASKLLKESIKNQEHIMIEQGRFFNRIWMYLSLAVDMKKLQIIE